MNRRGWAVIASALLVLAVGGCTLAGVVGGDQADQRSVVDRGEGAESADRAPTETSATAGPLGASRLPAISEPGSVDGDGAVVRPDSIDRSGTTPVVIATTTPVTPVTPVMSVMPVTPVEPVTPVVVASSPAVGIGARPIPDDNISTAGAGAPAPYALVTGTTAGGHVGVELGCAAGTDAASLDRWLSTRLGPVLGWDYQHVYPLGGDRFLWLFQDTFIDHTGTVTDLGRAHFLHNTAMVQTGRCFTLLHHGTPELPVAFEVGTGTVGARSRWFWPMGGEVANGRLRVFWAEMVKDPYDPVAPDGLGWHPVAVHLASYDTRTLARTSFGLATDAAATPMYGYAVASDNTHTYLFGNSFEQNLVREGGYWGGRHSATDMWLARVPRGQLQASPEYRTADGWSSDRSAAVPISTRFHAENPMQPRFLAGSWVSAAKVNGYWGEELVVDAAPNPWGPWSAAEQVPLLARNADPLGNTYHAHLLPWLGADGSILVSVSTNARDMLRHAWPRPARYRPMVLARAFPYLVATAPPPDPTPTTTTTLADTTTTSTLPPDTAAPGVTTTTTPGSTTTTMTSPSTTAPTTTTSTTAPTTTTTTPTATTTILPSG